MATEDTWRMSAGEIFETLEEFENRVEGWELLVDSHGTKIFRRPCEKKNNDNPNGTNNKPCISQVSGLFEYKVFGNLENILPEVFFQVYMDLEYRRTWDSFVKELYEVETDNQKVIYWELKYPFPLANRDYIYVRNVKTVEHNSKKAYVVKAYSVPSNLVPERGGIVRVSEYIQTVVITAHNKNGTTAYMEYFDNPGGMIPSWIINWTAKTGVIDFLTTMERACQGYDEYLKKKSLSSEKKSLVCQ